MTRLGPILALLLACCGGQASRGVPRIVNVYETLDLPGGADQHGWCDTSGEETVVLIRAGLAPVHQATFLVHELLHAFGIGHIDIDGCYVASYPHVREDYPLCVQEREAVQATDGSWEVRVHAPALADTWTYVRAFLNANAGREVVR